MNTIAYTDKFIVEAYSSVLSNLNFTCRVELMERLIKSFKNQPKETYFSTNDFIPEKSAEQIITEIQQSRSCGNTRVFEHF